MNYYNESRYCFIKPFNKESFSTRTEWVGLYIAAASFICTLAMAADVVRGFYIKKLWFPCRHFTLNVATLTVLGVAIKLAMDLDNPMPGSLDQFSKVSSLVFMETSIAYFMPSLGNMEMKDVLMNMISLGILVIVNVSYPIRHRLALSLLDND